MIDVIFVNFNSTQEEGWVVCRVFKKRITAMRKVSEHESPIWYEDQVSFMPDLESPKNNSHSNNLANYHIPYPCKKELDLPYQVPHEHFLQLPLLESPKLLQSANGASMAGYSLDINHTASTLQPSPLAQENHQIQRASQGFRALYANPSNEQIAVDQLTDWRVLDKFVASQLSHGDPVLKENISYSNTPNMFHGSSNSMNVVVRHLEKQEMVPADDASMSTSSCQVALWK